VLDLPLFFTKLFLFFKDFEMTGQVDHGQLAGKIILPFRPLLSSTTIFSDIVFSFIFLNVRSI